MASESQVSVRELKNRTAQILRRVEAGERVIVTKRGHPVAVIEPLSEAPAPVLDSIYQRLKRQNEARTPGLSGHSKAAITRDFERISRKGARVIFLIGIGAKWIGWSKVIGLVFSDSDQLRR